MIENLSLNPENPARIPLFERKDNRGPSLKEVFHINKLKLLLWPIEIQNWREIDKKEEITIDEIIEIYKKFRDNKEITKEEILRFRAGSTKFKNDPLFWKHDYEKNPEQYKKDEVVLLKMLYRIGVKNEVNDILDEFKEDEDLIENFKQILTATLQGKSEEDSRASSALYESIWYMEQMNFPAKNQNIILETIFDVELFYRNKERKNEQNPKNENLKELSFNHLIRVQRIAWGLLDSAQKNDFAGFSEADKTESQKIINNPQEMLKLSLIALGHDLLEDGKFTNPAKLHEFIKNIVEKHFPDEADEIANQVIDSVDRLNTRNFVNEDETRNFDVYINGGTFTNPKGEKQKVRPLTFMERLVKFADISHNYQTKVKTSSEKELKNKELKNKIPAYMKFIGKNLNLATNLPWRITNKMMKYNLATLLKYEEWQELFKIHKRKKIPKNLDNWSLD